jgi:3-oxoacyl-[acyl-carrier protein] reductase
LGSYSSPQSAHLFDVLTHNVQDFYKAAQANSEVSHVPCPKLHGIDADIMNPASVSQLLSAIDQISTAMKIDILILNASIISRPKLDEASDTDIESSLIGNL